MRIVRLLFIGSFQCDRLLCKLPYFVAGWSVDYSIDVFLESCPSGSKPLKAPRQSNPGQCFSRQLLA